MRVLYDTSAVVTILARRGEILKLKSDVLMRLVEPIVSDYILDEIEEVLSTKFMFTKQKAKSHTRLYGRIATTVNPKGIEKISRDPNDDPVLAAAVIGDVEYIVT
ncbi:MAG TPA: putative toxin-antitoxin system toxin component, PIN family, partial [Candidatus Saccharimonadales bacterium]